jgi:Ubiquitin interaction motif
MEASDSEDEQLKLAIALSMQSASEDAAKLDNGNISSGKDTVIPLSERPSKAPHDLLTLRSVFD